MALSLAIPVRSTAQAPRGLRGQLARGKKLGTVFVKASLVLTARSRPECGVGSRGGRPLPTTTTLPWRTVDVFCGCAAGIATRLCYL